MATLTPYKGLQIVNPVPTGAGGLAIQDDFKSLVDWNPKSVWAQSSDPTVNDDDRVGVDFQPGSLWLRNNVTPLKLFVCQSAATGAAVWVPIPLKLVQDPSPQLGGNLDVNGQAIDNPSGAVVVKAGGRTSITVKNSGGPSGNANEVFLGPTATMPARGLPLVVESLAPGHALFETDAGTDAKGWDFFASAGSLFFRCVNDAVNAATNWLKLDRSGTTPTLLTISVPMTHQQTACPYQVATDGATVTFNLGLSDVHAVTLGGNRTLAVSNSRVGQRFNVSLKQDATGSRTVTWWSGISWPGGTAPTLTTTANKTDVFEFVCTATNTSYVGRVFGQNY